MRTARRPAGEGRSDVLVDAVADVDDLPGGSAGLFDDAGEEAASASPPPPLGRADEVDVWAEKVLVDGIHVPAAPRRKPRSRSAARQGNASW
jgi:hypothetical protein